ncbi:MAG: nuclear transport factor 2 family protein, partial [Acidobacteriota bacterium]
MRSQFAAIIFAATLSGQFSSIHAQRVTLESRIDKLEAQVTLGEDARAIKKLQRAYSYYVDKGMWEDVANLFTDDAVGNYPAGTFIGKASLREHLYKNVGSGDIGLGDGRIYNHMNLQPVIHIAANGREAKGRWRAL